MSSETFNDDAAFFILLKTQLAKIFPTLLPKVEKYHKPSLFLWIPEWDILSQAGYWWC